MDFKKNQLDIRQLITNRERSIATTLQWNMVIDVVLFLIIIFIIRCVIETNQAKAQVERTLSNALDNVDETISAMSGYVLYANEADILLSAGKEDGIPLYDVKEGDIADIDSDGVIGTADINAYLNQCAEFWFYDELNIIDPEGVIRYSSDDSFVNFDMHSDAAKENFFRITTEKGSYSEPMPVNAPDGATSRVYAAMVFDRDCFFGKKGSVLEIGVASEKIFNLRMDYASLYAQNVSVGTNGNFLVFENEPNRSGNYRLVGEKGMIAYQTLGGRNDERLYAGHYQPARNHNVHNYRLCRLRSEQST